MFSLFIVFFSFSKSLATKFLFLNDEPCMTRPTLTDMNSVELKYYPFMISLNVMGVVMSYLQKCVFQKKQKTYVKAFNMITDKDEAKAMA